MLCWLDLRCQSPPNRLPLFRIPVSTQNTQEPDLELKQLFGLHFLNPNFSWHFFLKILLLYTEPNLPVMRQGLQMGFDVAAFELKISQYWCPS